MKLVKIARRAGYPLGGAPGLPLYQCLLCAEATTDRGRIERHVARQHVVRSLTAVEFMPAEAEEEPRTLEASTSTEPRVSTTPANPPEKEKAQDGKADGGKDRK